MKIVIEQTNSNEWGWELYDENNKLIDVDYAVGMSLYEAAHRAAEAAARRQEGATSC